MDQSPILSLENVAVTYQTRKRDVDAVRDVSFEISRGENLGLVGESGCGKSTVAFSIVNFLGRNGRVTRGNILFKGAQLRDRSEEDLRKLRGADISMVYQEPMSALNPSMRIQDQLAESLITHSGFTRHAAFAESVEALKRVYMPDPQAVMLRYPHQLSGGQQQRVLIAMAMLNNPSLLIMDEPTTALDVTVEAAVLDLIAELQERYQTATLYISHNLGVVARVSHKVAVMYAGEIVELADTRSIYRSPMHPYTMGLMRCLPDVDAPKGTRTLYPIEGRVPSPANLPVGCIFSPRCELAQPDCTLQHPELVEMAPAHQVRCLRSLDWKDAKLIWDMQALAKAPTLERAHPGLDAVLEVDQAKVYYPVPFKTVGGIFGLEKRRYVRASDDVSFHIHRGRTLGIVGESGCGKSTLAKAIVGLEPLHAGRVEFLGLDISKPVSQRTKNSIKELQMVFQDPNGVLNPSYSVGDQIAFSLRRFKTVPADQVHAEVERLLQAVKLDASYYTRLPRQLSGGEKQRIGIARAISTNPAMLVCDEPVSALDVSVQAAVLNLLLEIRISQNTTMILISHDLSSVRFFADDVAVMYLGRVVEIGPCETIYQPPNHPYTTALLAAVPRPDPDLKPSHIRLSGRVPSAVNPPAGCRFNTRCPFKIGVICEQDEPPERDMGSGHVVVCHYTPEDLAKLNA
ncbi:MAG: ABC transporter ATP-binding protein [Chloroflexi bacterium]|jgi:peptide/nickel transport system ATP-binding protein|nr:ABC transporter ATP-binding protein [Chloroflexota bacterium]